jgi:hypothetical protein
MEGGVVLQKTIFNLTLIKYSTPSIFASFFALSSLLLGQVGTDFMEQTIAILDSAVKSEDREEMHAILAAAVQFFYAMVMHKLG